ncbi:nucleotidyltransferase [Alkalihalophilus pseudofirmus]|nr:nucleotidyltransferase [Alkalihalophilus pseudofirmus]
MLSQQEILEVLSRNLKTWKNTYGVKRIALFGSYSREEQKDTSDIDLLVEFDEKALTFDNYMDLKINLEDLFQKPIDLVIFDDIKPALKPSILRSAKYAEGA